MRFAALYLCMQGILEGIRGFWNVVRPFFYCFFKAAEMKVLRLGCCIIFLAGVSEDSVKL